jgi:hypothetical protein
MKEILALIMSKTASSTEMEEKISSAFRRVESIRRELRVHDLLILRNSSSLPTPFRKNRRL